MAETEKLIITLIGKVNSGKSSLFSRLFGMDLNSNKISPVSGWTKEIEMKMIYKDVFLADTPGLEDVEESVSRKTIDFIGESDIFVHIINAAEGVTETVQKCSFTLYDTQLPLITVVNKIDTLSAEDINILKADSISKLSHLSVESDLHFISARHDQGTVQLKDNLMNVLKTNEKKLKLGRFFRVNRPDIEKMLAEEAHSFVNYATARSVMISGSFIPFSETIPLTLNQYYMIIKIGGVYGETVGYNQFKSILGSLGSMVIGGQLASTFFPGWKMAVAGSVTYALGRVMTEWISSGMSMPIEKLKEKFVQYKSNFKQKDVEEKVKNDSRYETYNSESENYYKENKK